MIKALLDAYPDAAKAKDNVRCGRGRRVLCPLLSHSSHMHPCPLPRLALSRRCAEWEAAKDLAKTDAIKALLNEAGPEAWFGTAADPRRG